MKSKTETKLAVVTVMDIVFFGRRVSHNPFLDKLLHFLYFWDSFHIAASRRDTASRVPWPFLWAGTGVIWKRSSCWASRNPCVVDFCIICVAGGQALQVGRAAGNQSAFDWEGITRCFGYRKPQIMKDGLDICTLLDCTAGCWAPAYCRELLQTLLTWIRDTWQRAWHVSCSMSVLLEHRLSLGSPFSGVVFGMSSSEHLTN